MEVLLVLLSRTMMRPFQYTALLQLHLTLV
jgi:hypothetical protein